MSTHLRTLLALLASLCCMPAVAVGQTGGANPREQAPATTPTAPATTQPTPPPAATPVVQDDSVVAVKKKVVLKSQEQMAKLGTYTGGIDGIIGNYTLRGYCAIQLLTDAPGRDAPARLAPLPLNDRKVLYRITRDQLNMRMRGVGTFIRISRRCQTLFLVKGGKVKRIRPVSTGRAGVDSKGRASFATPRGRFSIQSKFGRNQISQFGPPELKRPGWDYSQDYEFAPMYLPMYFQGGKAIHGEPTPDDVRPFKASHGCVRMIKFHQYDLTHQVKVGTVVWVT